MYLDVTFYRALIGVKMFGPIVYNRAIVNKRQSFLKVVVLVIIIDQCN